MAVEYPAILSNDKFATDATAEGQRHMKVLSVNTGLPREVRWHGRSVITGIFKEPVHGRVALRKLNLDGDRQADLSVHGGEYKAVYCYPLVHYDYWKRELPARELPTGIFGENFTLDGLLEESVYLGDRFSVGSAEVVVTQPRLPCDKLGIRFEDDNMVKRFLASGRKGKKRCLAAPDSNSVNLDTPMLSPDGKNVAFVRETTIRVRDLFIAPFQGGIPHRLTSEGRLLGQFVWAPDSKSVIFTSDREGVGGRRVWRVPINGGPIEPENDALLAKIDPGQMPVSALSRDRRRMAYVDHHIDNSSIRRVRLAAPGGRVIANETVLQSPVEIDGPRISPDGTRVAFQSALSGARNIWTSDADGHNTLQLTSFSGELVGTPRWSPDGKWLVFVRRPRDHAQISMVDAEGRNMRALTDGEHENDVPIWSRNGKAVYFASDRSGSYELWKHDISSSVSTQITRHGGFIGVESYDGRYLYDVKYFCSGATDVLSFTVCVIQP